MVYTYRRQMPKALQQPKRPSAEEIQFYRHVYDADEFSHLEPTDDDLTYDQEAIKPAPVAIDGNQNSDISVANYSNFQPDLFSNPDEMPAS